MILRTGLGAAMDPVACDQQRAYDATIEAYKPGLESALRSYGWTPVFTDVRSSGGNLATFGCPDLWVHQIYVGLQEVPGWQGDLVVGLIDGSTGPIPSPQALARSYIAQAKSTLPIPMAENYGTGRGGGDVTDSDYYWSTVQRQLAKASAAETGTVRQASYSSPERTAVTRQHSTTEQVTPATSVPVDGAIVQIESRPWYESLMSGNTLLLAGAAVVAFMVFSKGGSK